MGVGGGLDREGQRGKNWDNCNRITIIFFKKEKKNKRLTPGICDCLTVIFAEVHCLAYRDSRLGLLVGGCSFSHCTQTPDVKVPTLIENKESFERAFQ